MLQFNKSINIPVATYRCTSAKLRARCDQTDGTSYSHLQNNFSFICLHAQTARPHDDFLIFTVPGITASIFCPISVWECVCESVSDFYINGNCSRLNSGRCTSMRRATLEGNIMRQKCQAHILKMVTVCVGLLNMNALERLSLRTWVTKVLPGGTFHMACAFGFRLYCIQSDKAWTTLLCRNDGGFLLLKSFPLGFDVLRRNMSMKVVANEYFCFKPPMRNTWNMLTCTLVKNSGRTFWPACTFI